MRAGFPIRRTVAFCAALSLWLATDLRPAQAAVDFNRDIRPLLNKQCTSCHGGVKRAGGLSLLFREAVLQPAKSGAVPVKPGDPAGSELLRRVQTTDPDDRMPPPKHGPALSAAEVGTLRQWIEEGAAWSGHWAYTPPVAPALPKVSESRWCRQPLDWFILARLDREGLQPAAEADRRQWLRRVTFDLTGLPPTLEEVQAFEADRRRGAHERVVERLLKSPRFGERWAAMWLDLARYADSQGYEKDAARTVWPWRDWLIRALNDDLPFDAFTTRLVAGDLLPDATLPDVVASTFQRNTPTNAEGGTDDEEFRVSAVVDRVATTWKTWQSISFNCVQCHAHPYDPIEHSEFYQFLALYNTSKDWDLNGDDPRLDVPVNPADFGRARELDRRARALREAEFAQAQALEGREGRWQTLTPKSAVSTLSTRLVIRPLATGGGEVLTEGTVSHDSKFTLELSAPAAGAQVTALRIEALPVNPEKAGLRPELGFVLSEVRVQQITPANEAEVQASDAAIEAARKAIDAAVQAEQKAPDAEKEARRKETAERREELRKLDRSRPGEVRLEWALGDEVEPFHDPQASLDPDSRGWGALPRITHSRHLVLLPAEPFELPAGGRLRVTIRQEAAPNDMAPLVMNRSRYAISSDPAWTALGKGGEFRDRRKELAGVREARAKIRSVGLPVMAEQEAAFRRPTAMFVRGDWQNHGPLVQPGVPKLFPPLPEGVPADRLALARWLVSPANPLTARVFVNRVWDQLFGVGLVETVDDFGTSGMPPSHPELLDHLAVRFRDDLKWSFKALLREVVLSAAYRQDAAVTPALRERDPRNRLLARGPRNRLTAEMVRDNALAVAGLLSTRQFGPPVMPGQPEGIWRVVYSSQKWIRSEGEDAYRRALYTYWRRSTPYPSLVTFDAPGRLVCAANRLATSTPLQALVTLNDPVYMECAVALAGRLQREQPGDVSRQVAHGYELATGRAPSPADVADLLAVHRTALAAYQADPKLAESLGASPEAAALALVANTLLNLDAVLTK